MLNPLWQVSETYISYNDVVDKWAASSVLQAALADRNALAGGGKQEGHDLVSAAVVLNIVFPDKGIGQIIKDLDRAQKSATEKAKVCKENKR